MEELTRKLTYKTITKKELYNKVENNFDLLPQILNGLFSDKAIIRYGCARVLMELSAKYPQQLYPYFDRFIGLLESKYRILVWNAIAIIANLCEVDKQNKFETSCDKFFGLLKNEYLVTVANVVIASKTVATAKPHLIPQITTELLKTEKLPANPHLTEECKKVIAENTIRTFESFFSKLDNHEKTRVLNYVNCYVESSRKTLRQQAQKFLEKWSQHTHKN